MIEAPPCILELIVNRSSQNNPLARMSEGLPKVQPYGRIRGLVSRRFGHIR